MTCADGLSEYADMPTGYARIPLRLAVLILAFAPVLGCGWAEWPPPATRAPDPVAAPPPVARAEPMPRGVVDVAALPASRSSTGASAPLTVPPVVTVGEGDTVYALAQRYGVPVRTIVDRNQLRPPYQLRAGERLAMPQRREHVVGPDETLESIARSEGVDLYLLAGANGLIAPYRVRPGQRLTVPVLPPADDAEPVSVASLSTEEAPVAVVASRAPAATPPTSDPTEMLEPTSAAAPAPIRKPLPDLGDGFIWPVKGKVISGFGPKNRGRHNDGINIAVRRGTPVRASESGVVAYVGNELRGFGNLILIQHADGWVSAYAHNDALLVERGDTVYKGQVVARAGSTGSVNQPQLHFQLRKGKRAVDPRKHLISGT